jgi:hypothetical protein
LQGGSYLQGGLAGGKIAWTPVFLAWDEGNRKLMVAKTTSLTGYSLTPNRLNTEGTIMRGCQEQDASQPCHQPQVAPRLSALRPLGVPKPRPRCPWSLDTCARVSTRALPTLTPARHPPITRPFTTPKPPPLALHARPSRSTSSLAKPKTQP